MSKQECCCTTSKGNKCTRSVYVQSAMCLMHWKIQQKTIEYNKNMKSCITITFGDVAENHVGMQKIGDMADKGFSLKDLKKVKNSCEEEGYEVVLHKLSKSCPVECENAYVLVIKNGLQLLGINHEDLFNEELNLSWDMKMKDRGVVKNKIARYNLCYSEETQKADYENGKGTIIAFEDVPLLQITRKNIGKKFGRKFKNLKAEGNYYYDTKKCYIGFHGDAERRKVVAIRLGDSESLPLVYQWYVNTKPVGERINVEVSAGDIYIMSDKATGYDWKKRSMPTLRHAVNR